MMLLLDLGNSVLKWACYQDERLQPGGHLPLLDEWEQPLAQALSDTEEPDRILIASVSSDSLTQSVTQWCSRRWGVEPEMAQAEARAAGVTNAYRDPGRLGVDRWLTLLAARARSIEPTCVVDCGTAVTVDVLDAEGAHLGGLIVPGLAMMTSSLAACARVHLDAEPDPSAPLLAADTVSAVRGGTLYAAVAFVDRVLSDVEREVGQPMQRLLTGGDAQTIAPLLRHPFEHAPDLVLEGLAVWAKDTACAS